MIVVDDALYGRFSPASGSQERRKTWVPFKGIPCPEELPLPLIWSAQCSNGDIPDIPDEGKEGLFYITRRIASPLVTASAHRLLTTLAATARKVPTPFRARVCQIPNEPYVEEVSQTYIMPTPFRARVHQIPREPYIEEVSRTLPKKPADLGVPASLDYAEMVVIDDCGSWSFQDVITTLACRPKYINNVPIRAA